MTSMERALKRQKRSEAKAQVKTLCKSYRDNKTMLRDSTKSLEILLNKKNGAKTVVTLMAYATAEQQLTQRIRNCTEAIVLFDSLKDVLPAPEKSIIEQLYVEGKRRMDVVDSEGVPMEMNTVDAIVKRAMRRMASKLERMQDVDELAKIYGGDNIEA